MIVAFGVAGAATVEPVLVDPRAGIVLVRLVAPEATCTVRTQQPETVPRLVHLRALGPGGTVEPTWHHLDLDPAEYRSPGRLKPIELELSGRVPFDRPGTWTVTLVGPCEGLEAAIDVVVPPPPPPEIARAAFREAAAAATGDSSRPVTRWAQAAYLPAALELALTGDDFALRVLGSTRGPAAAAARLDYGLARFDGAELLVNADARLRDVEALDLETRERYAGPILRVALRDPEAGPFVSDLLALVYQPSDALLAPQSDAELALTLWALAQAPTLAVEDRPALVARGLSAGGVLAALALEANRPSGALPATHAERLALLADIGHSADPARLPTLLALIEDDGRWVERTAEAGVRLRTFESRSGSPTSPLCRAAVDASRRLPGARLPVARALVARARAQQRPFEAIEALTVLVAPDAPCGAQHPADLAQLTARWAEWVEAHADAIAVGHTWEPPALPSGLIRCVHEGTWEF